ncbi:unnamed protein product [Hyaloperonospora brassicae]|uniref:Uncharacterized protein n=1 Tax=Hyaloperonospora brassicae TaxID=162125 RepID=A0AAV0TFZ4_HYABA|nr:unnamed protein product [Hyaloperonospora brassicae]
MPDAQHADDLPLFPSSRRRPPRGKSELCAMAELDEYICYGDRLAFLCDGQLLALTRKFNLTYQQMALLATSTVATCGLMGIAGFFVWRKGLFRKRYAALFGDEIYNEDGCAAAPTAADAVPPIRAERGRREKQSAATLSHTTTGNSVAGEPGYPVGGSKAAHGSVAFRLFEFDPKKQQLVFSSVGLPVKFGTPLVVVHAETGRAIKYLTHKGAVTISKPPVNLAFHRQVRTSLVAMEEPAVSLSSAKRTRPQPPSTASMALSQLSSNASRDAGQSTAEIADATMTDDLPNEETGVDDEALTVSVDQADVMMDLADQSQDRGQPRSQRQVHVQTSYPRGKKLQSISNGSSKPRSRSCMQQPSVRSSQDRAQRRSCDQPRSQPLAYERGDSSRRTSTDAAAVDNADAPTVSSRRGRHRSSVSSAPGSHGSSSQAFCRSISESYMNMVSDLSDTLMQQRDRQRERQELRRRQKVLMKDLPNMSFSNPSGKYYVATVEPVRHQTSGSNYHQPVAPGDEYLRWGQPMSLISNFNGRACGIRPREYYKDSDLYLTTEATLTTIVPLREDGDLKCLAKESTRFLAHLEKRRVSVSVGTYNVWMMPRKVSAFTSCSPKKNTRARMIGDILPPCDIWVLTECFDHRARDTLLNKMSEAGYFFSRRR